MRNYCYTFLFLLVTISSACYSQDSLKQGKKIYKLELFRAVQGTIQFSQEYSIGSNYSMHVGLMGTYASTRGLAKPYLSVQEFKYTDASTNTIYTLDDVEALGYGVNFQFRKYLTRSPLNPLHGFYISPELFYRRLNLTSLVSEDKEIKRTLNLGYVGYAMGYQRIIRDIISLDTYVGGGFFLSQYTDEAHLTRYRNNYQIDFTGMYFNMGVMIGIVR
jgi:hypothetical protein